MFIRIHAALIMAVLLLSAPAEAAIKYKFVAPTAQDLSYEETEAALDVAVGINYYQIYNFDNVTLPPGVSIVLSNGTETVATWNELPALFNQNDLPAACYNFGSIANLGVASWWGGYAATNLPGNQLSSSTQCLGASDSQTTTFNIAPGASSFGIALSNFQSLDSPQYPFTNHELFVNGVDIGTIETLAGTNWNPGITLNAYLRIEATGRDVITSVGFQNIEAGTDFLGFSHLALQYSSAAPIVTPVISGTAGLNGWYTSTVKLSWLVAGNPKPTESGCTNETVSNTTGTTYTCTATNADGSAEQPAVIRVDKIAPTVAVKKPANNASYALNSVVAASYTCADTISGVASCVGTVADGSNVPTGTVGTQTFSVVATDNAGNAFTKTVTYTVKE